MKTTTINFRINDALKLQLESEAAAKRISLSEYIRRLLEGYYDQRQKVKCRVIDVSM